VQEYKKILDSRRNLILSVLVAALSCSTIALAETGVEEIAFDIGEVMHTFEGFGTHIWADMRHGAAELETLNIKYVRITKDWTSWDDMKQFRALTDRLGIKWLYVLWHAPAELTENGMLVDPDGFAEHWRDLVADLDRHGVRPHYVDLMNEPDSGGGWGTGIAPATYNRLVKRVRSELDDAGFEDVGIVGPGVTHLDWDKHNTQWFSALDEEAVADLVAFSTHSWDDGDLGHGGASHLETAWPDFRDSADLKDPGKPKWITEYATKETVFHGVRYPHPDKTGGYSAAFSGPYAVRVFENTLAHLNNGANILFYWCAEDKGKAWGYVDSKGFRKPIYYTLKALYPKIPLGARVVKPPEQKDAAVYAGAFLKGTRLVVGLANDGTVAQRRRLRLENAHEGFSIVESVAYEVQSAGDPSTESPGVGRVVDKNLAFVSDGAGEFYVDVTLPADSTLTLVCDAGEQ